MTSYTQTPSRSVALKIPHGRDQTRAVGGVLQHFAEITEPCSDAPMVLYQVTANIDWTKGATSIKPGSIRLNWRKLFESVPNSTLAAGGAYSEPWLASLAALAVWNAVVKQATVAIEPRDAVVLEALWGGRNSKHRIRRDQGYQRSLELFTEYAQPAPNEIEYENALDALCELECIELDGDEIWLRARYKKAIR